MVNKTLLHNIENLKRKTIFSLILHTPYGKKTITDKNCIATTILVSENNNDAGIKTKNKSILDPPERTNLFLNKLTTVFSAIAKPTTK